MNISSFVTPDNYLNCSDSLNANDTDREVELFSYGKVASADIANHLVFGGLLLDLAIHSREIPRN
ncbi:hypothetical protein AM10699_32830 [Acaryochloris marina MBIC10699]|nr:hypothetical protein AM10699_32830 [Acaryochloris marina MBIC10699]